MRENVAAALSRFTITLRTPTYSTVQYTFDTYMRTRYYYTQKTKRLIDSQKVTIPSKYFKK